MFYADTPNELRAHVSARLSLAQNLFGSLVDAGRVWPVGAELRLLYVLIHASLEGSK